MSTIPEHPMATKLYRKFKAGGAIMTKTEAYDIGSELDALQARIQRLEQQIRCQKTWECLDPNGHEGPCVNTKETN